MASLISEDRNRASMTQRADSVMENAAVKILWRFRWEKSEGRNRLRLNQHQTLQHEVRVVGDDSGDVIGEIE